MDDMKARYLEAPTFREYLQEVEKHRQLWHDVYERARVPEDLLEEAPIPPWPCRFLALSEDWCGDAVNVLPVVARLAEALPGGQLRVLGRDANPDLMDAHLTGGRSRSIPVVMLLDDRFEERTWWGPRPSDLQEWVLSEGLALPREDRYREIRRWYARDRGRSIVRELVEAIQSACAAV